MSGRDFAAVVGPPPVYKGCRCPVCLPSAAPPEPPPHVVEICQEAVDAVVASAFGPVTPPG